METVWESEPVKTNMKIIDAALQLDSYDWCIALQLWKCLSRTVAGRDILLSVMTLHCLLTLCYQEVSRLFMC